MQLNKNNHIEKTELAAENITEVLNNRVMGKKKH